MFGHPAIVLVDETRVDGKQKALKVTMVGLASKMERLAMSVASRRGVLQRVFQHRGEAGSWG